MSDERPWIHAFLRDSDRLQRAFSNDWAYSRAYSRAKALIDADRDLAAKLCGYTPERGIRLLRRVHYLNQHAKVRKMDPRRLP